MENRYYIQGTKKDGTPADIEGIIINKKTNEKIQEIKTEHEGRGRASFIPQSDVQYVLQVTKPTGIFHRNFKENS